MFPLKRGRGDKKFKSAMEQYFFGNSEFDEK